MVSKTFIVFYNNKQKAIRNNNKIYIYVAAFNGLLYKLFLVY